MNGSASENEKSLRSLDKNLPKWDEKYRANMYEANRIFVSRLLAEMTA